MPRGESVEDDPDTAVDRGELSGGAPAPPPTGRTAVWRSLDMPLVVLLGDTFTMAVGFYMLVPLLAYYLLDDLALTVGLVGVLAAVRTASQQGLMPWSGALGDRLGHRRAIAAGVLVRMCGFAMFAFVESTAGLLTACLLTGLGGSLFHPASYAAYAALAGDRNRVAVYSLRETLSNLGFVLGPVVGGVLAGIDFRLVCLASAGLFAVAFVITVVGLPRDLGRAGSPSAEAGGLLLVVRDRSFLGFCVLMAGTWVLFSQLYLAVPIRAREVLPGSVGVGVVYSLAAVVMVAVMLPLNRWVDRRLSSTTALAAGTAGLGAGLLLMGAWPSLPGLVLGVTLFTLGQVVFQPIMNARVSQFAEEGAVASYFGIHGIALAGGGVLGSVGGGALYGLLDAGNPVLAVLPWLVFALWAVVVAGFLLARQDSP